MKTWLCGIIIILGAQYVQYWLQEEEEEEEEGIEDELPDVNSPTCFSLF
jgi:hypothetical protein